jgi:hypothetical protein
MNRGKQQVLLGYLPGKTFDFDKIGTIARVERIRGVPRTDLNVRLILKAIEDQARAWPEANRPVFRDLERAADRFVLIEPKGVEAAMFPLVFWCQNPRCGIIFETREAVPNTEVCASCHSGRLVQLRFVKVHRCGALDPLTSPQCARCSGRQKMALDTRGSERISDFQWVCRSCGATASVFGGKCPCNWPGTDSSLKTMSVEVHRAGRTFYPHYTVLLNQPGRELSAFLGISRWQAVAASMYLGMPESRGMRLVDFVATVDPARPNIPFVLSDGERARLLAQGMSEELVAQFEKMQALLQTSRSEAAAASSPQGIAALLMRRSGVPWEVWEKAGQEMLEAIMPLQSGSVTELHVRPSEDGGDSTPARESVRRVGLRAVTLARDFPITTATFGFSRSDYQPDACRLNPFPADRDHAGRFPIFVDVVQADALLLTLDHNAVMEWMSANGYAPDLPSGEDAVLSARGYFVQLLDGVALRESIQLPHARLVFGLIHSLSHLAVRRASLLCGLDRTSLSEYLLPRTLTCAIYCNHRFGATIGALSALFEQSIVEWLSDIRSSRRCVYDPVCNDEGGSCHACSHLAETSCRFFNLNLGRPFLFGGRDPVLGEIRTGFFDFVAER